MSHSLDSVQHACLTDVATTFCMSPRAQPRVDTPRHFDEDTRQSPVTLDRTGETPDTVEIAARRSNRASRASELPWHLEQVGGRLHPYLGEVFRLLSERLHLLLNEIGLNFHELVG